MNGFEGLGINKFSKQKKAAMHYLKYVTGSKFQLEMNIGGTLPSSLTAVLNSSEVKSVYAIGDTIAKQGQSVLNRYATPYNWDPPISDAIHKLVDGSMNAKQAHTAAVEGVEKIIQDYYAA